MENIVYRLWEILVYALGLELAGWLHAHFGG